MPEFGSVLRECWLPRALNLPLLAAVGRILAVSRDEAALPNGRDDVLWRGSGSAAVVRCVGLSGMAKSAQIRDCGHRHLGCIFSCF